MACGDIFGVRFHWYNNPFITDAKLTCKLTTLLALTTASMMSMIQHLNTEFMAKDKDNFQREGQAPQAITYFAFSQDKALCVVEKIKEYINRSKPWRESNHVSSVRSCNAVVSYTISGWLKKTVEQAEIN